ncbi:MAG TPA: hypothetical protein VF677_13970 [Flavobacterium sp.]|jgi:hypothetical protein
MKSTYLNLLILFLFATAAVSAQKTAAPKIVINIRGIGTYSTLKDLQAMNKGDLITLYKERVKILINIIPYMGMTTKVGITLKDLGIPVSPENDKAMDKEVINRANYLLGLDEFLNTFIGYSDKSNLIYAIMFYEDELKKIYSQE